MSSQFIPPKKFALLNEEEKLLILEAETLYRKRTKIDPQKVESVLGVMIQYRKWRNRGPDQPNSGMPTMPDLKAAINGSIEILERELELTKPVDGPWLTMMGFTYVPDIIDGNMQLYNYEMFVNECRVEVRLTESMGVMVTLKIDDNYIDMKAPNRGCIDSLLKMLA